MELKNIPLSSLISDPLNRAIDETHVNRIAATIEHAGGIIQPLAVRKTNDSDTFMITAGHHRFEAAKKAGLADVPCKIIHDTANPIYVSIIENTIRKDLQFSDKVAAVRAWMEMDVTLTPEAVYQKLSIHKRRAAEMMFIAELPQEYIIKADTNPPLEKQFIAYARLPEERRTQIARNVTEYAAKKEGKFPPAPQLEAIINRFTLGIKCAPFDISACFKCPHNSACQNSLFADEGAIEDGVCNNPECYDGKVEASRMATANKIATEHDIPAEQIVHYSGKDDIHIESITINDKTSKSWKADLLGEAASGCVGCEKRCVITQRTSIGFTAAMHCADQKCYDTMRPKETPVKTPTTGTDATQANTPGSNAPVTTSKTKAAAVFKPEIADSKAVGNYRRKAIEATADQIIRGMLHMLKQSTNMSIFGIADHEDIVKADEKTLFKYMKELVGHRLKDFDNSIMRYVFGLFVKEENYRTETSLNDKAFLESLTRAELLGMLDEADYITTAGEEAWKNAVKAKKGGLVEIIVEHQFDPMFLPKALIPTKTEHFRKSV